MAGPATSASNALGYARARADQAGLKHDGYVARVTPYADGWWCRFERKPEAARAGGPAKFSVRVSNKGETELFMD